MCISFICIYFIMRIQFDVHFYFWIRFSKENEIKVKRNCVYSRRRHAIPIKGFSVLTLRGIYDLHNIHACADKRLSTLKAPTFTAIDDLASRILQMIKAQVFERFLSIWNVWFSTPEGLHREVYRSVLMCYVCSGCGRS